jgi:hypothetical protein
MMKRLSSVISVAPPSAIANPRLSHPHGVERAAAALEQHELADTHDDREDHRQIEISGREIRDQEDDRRQEIFGELIKRGLHRRRFDWSGAETLSERRSRCDLAVRAGCYLTALAPG